MSTHPLLKPSSRVAELGHIDPQSATTAKSTAWVDISLYENIEGKAAVGVIATNGTVDVKIRQATSDAGAGAKDVTGKAATQLTEAGTDSSKQVLINTTASDFDHANGFRYACLTITPATAAALIYGELRGFDCKYDVAHASTVDEVV